MSKPIASAPRRTARVTRLTPPGSTLTGERGRTIAIGDVVSDGEAVVLATPDGSAGGVTLDRAGVAIAIKTVALPSVGGGLSAVNPFSSVATEVAPSPRPTNMGTAPPIIAVPVAGAATRQPAPAVKPPIGVRSGSTIEAAKAALDSATTPASVEGVAARPAATAAKPSNS